MFFSHKDDNAESLAFFLGNEEQLDCTAFLSSRSEDHFI